MRCSPTHRRLTLLVIIVLVVPTVVALFPPAPVQGQGGDVVISQVYAGGQSGTAPIRSDYIELFNPGTDPVRIEGWSVQYASREGTTWRRARLAGTIPPGGFYLGQGVSGEAGAALPTPDATGGLALAAGNGRLALVRTTSPLTCGADPGCATASDVVDFVGYGPGTVSFAGSGPAPSPGRDGALVLAVDGCGDTDDNATDYQIDLPAPLEALPGVANRECPGKEIEISLVQPEQLLVSQSRCDHDVTQRPKAIVAGVIDECPRLFRLKWLDLVANGARRFHKSRDVAVHLFPFLRLPERPPHGPGVLHGLRLSAGSAETLEDHVEAKPASVDSGLDLGR
jgi:hypothetical protein